ncbi:MAG TPA: hypothetical protein VFM14_06270 [Gemmatimonadales bacterium]|nr:hypothetical protein [Gemmatimonadales bacterium]
MRILLTLVIACLAGSVSTALAQGGWGLGIEAGIQRFWGGSGPLPGSEDVALRPYRPTHFGVRLDRDVGGMRVGVGARYSQSAIGGEFEGGATIFTDGFALVELAAEAGAPVTRLGGGAVVRAVGGPVLSLWMPAEESTRTRMGVRAGIELEAPLGGAISATTRVQGGIGGSALDEQDVPPGYEVRSMPSLGVSLGLRLRL